MSFHTICYPLYYITVQSSIIPRLLAELPGSAPLRSAWSARNTLHAGCSLSGAKAAIWWGILTTFFGRYIQDMILYEMQILYHMIWYHPCQVDMIWYDVMCYNVLWCDMICISHHGDLLNISQDICMVFEVIWYDPWNAEHCDWPSWMEWRSLFSGTKNYIRMWCICWYS